MDFAPDERTHALAEELREFLAAHVYPAEARFAAEADQLATDGQPWTTPPVMAELKAEARRRGLWNLFLPDPEHGAGLSTLQYAPLAELTGRSLYIAPESLNCAAPDTGNMEILAGFGTPDQQRQWLHPLLDGTIRSAFAMTEPDVASSDATNIATRIDRDGDQWVINGRKWWVSGALRQECAVLLVVGVTDPDAGPHGRHSIVAVPRDTPGVRIERGLRVYGYTDGPAGGHAEITLSDVRVPAGNLIGEQGRGFAIAQARLGPGRIHHCMRLVGAAERGLELLCRRVITRTTFGQPLADQGVVQSWIADARTRIEATRLLVLKTAWLIDTVGARAARVEISAIKLAAPQTAVFVLDKAIQAHGAAGLSQDFPLAALAAAARSLRLADGPDEVHRRALARHELAHYRPA